MKYKRGVVLKWTSKALKRLGDKAHRDDRMIVLAKDEVILFRGRDVLATSMYKTQDSFVEPAQESVPTGMTYNIKMSQAPNAPDVEPQLAKEFGYRIIERGPKLLDDILNGRG